MCSGCQPSGRRPWELSVYLGPSPYGALCQCDSGPQSGLVMVGPSISLVGCSGHREIWQPLSSGHGSILWVRVSFCNLFSLFHLQKQSLRVQLYQVCKGPHSKVPGWTAGVLLGGSLCSCIAPGRMRQKPYMVGTGKGPQLSSLLQLLWKEAAGQGRVSPFLRRPAPLKA